MRPQSNNIYRDKRRRRNNKNTSKAVVSAVLTVVLLGGVVFVGYKIGKPLISYLDNGKSNSSISSSENLISNDSTDVTTISSTTVSTDNVSSATATTTDTADTTTALTTSENNSSSAATTSGAAVTTTSVTGGNNSSSNSSSAVGTDNSNTVTWGHKNNNNLFGSIGALHVGSGNKNNNTTDSSNSSKTDTSSSSASSQNSTSSNTSNSQTNSSSNQNNNTNSNNSTNNPASDSNTDFHTDGNYVAPGQKDGAGGNGNTASNTVTNNSADTSQYATSTTFNGYSLTVGDLKTVSSLNLAIKNAGSNFKNIVVPLKMSGGKIYYKSSVQGAVNSNAINGSLTLAEIVNAITAQGYTPVAEISTLEDSTYSIAYADAGYTFTDGKTHWYDDSVEKGGKPWLSPQSSLTKQYLTQLINEITSAGFKTVICSDVNYPFFRASDLDLIGDSVKSPTRYKALIDLVAEMNKTAVNNNARLMIRIPATYIINGSAEVLKPAELPAGISIVPIIGYDDISSDMAGKAIQIIQNVQAKCGNNIDVIPCINAGGKDVSKAINALQGIGYTEYIIK